MSTHKWSQPSTGFVVWNLKILLGQSFILLLPLPLFSNITGVVEVVVKLILQSEPLHVLFNKSRPVFFCHIFVLMERGVLVPPNLDKLTLVAPPSMRDDLYSYLLPFCFNSSAYWMYIWKEFSKSSSISFLVKSSNPYRINDTLCRTAISQILDNLIFTIMSKGTPLSLTSPTLVMSVSHIICDPGCCWWEVVFDFVLAISSSSWVCWPCYWWVWCCWVYSWASSFCSWLCCWASLVYCWLCCCWVCC
jgi:hypothetical protein